MACRSNIPLHYELTMKFEFDHRNLIKFSYGCLTPQALLAQFYLNLFARSNSATQHIITFARIIAVVMFKKSNVHVARIIFLYPTLEAWKLTSFKQSTSEVHLDAPSIVLDIAAGAIYSNSPLE